MTVAPLAEAGPTSRPFRRGFGRRKFDKQPTQPAAVLIATNGVPIPPSAVSQALCLSKGEPVAVVTVARIYGSAYGLPNPGLMPTRREMAEQRAAAESAVRAIEAGGVEVWGQIAVTRRPAKAIAEAAKARGVRDVIVVSPGRVRWRSVLEGDLAKEVGRKLRASATVHRVTT